MNRTRIEWVRNPDGKQGYAWNPIRGCSHGCPYCYARRESRRLINRCGACYRFVPHLHEEKLDDPLKIKTPSTFFLCSMGDPFCKEVEDSWIVEVERTVEACPQHRFIVLTKNPARAYYHSLPVMDNVLFGISLDRRIRMYKWLGEFAGGRRPNIEIISFEPLLERINLVLEGLKWIIIGGQTRPNFYPPKEWVKVIVDEAKLLDIPVFMKPNLGPAYKGQLIQEFPEELWKEENENKT